MVDFSSLFTSAGLERLGIAALTIIAAFIVGKIGYFVFKKVGRKITEKTKNDIDDKLIDAVEEPIVAYIILAGFLIAFWNLEVQNAEIIGYFGKLMTVAFVAVTAWLAVRLAGIIIDAIIKPLAQKTDNELDDQLIPVLSKIAKLVIIVFAIIIVLGNLGYDVNALLAGVGVGGIAIAFAAQETIANLFGGFSLITDKTFKVGDVIKLDSGEMGSVKEITLRSTRLQLFDNTILTVPNGQLAKARIINYNQPDLTIRRSVKFGVEYGSSAEKVRKVVYGAIKPMAQILKEPAPRLDFDSMGDSSLNFTLYFYTELKDGYAAEREATERIYNALNKARIGIPFPTQTVYLKKK